VIQQKVSTYSHLRDCSKDHRKVILDIAPHFFSFAGDSLIADVIVSITALSDSSAERSLPSYLRKVENKYSILEIKKHYLTYTVVQSQRARIITLQPTIKKIAVHRNKVRAHHDKAFFDDPSKGFEEYP